LLHLNLSASKLIGVDGYEILHFLACAQFCAHLLLFPRLPPAALLQLQCFCKHAVNRFGLRVNITLGDRNGN